MLPASDVARFYYGGGKLNIQEKTKKKKEANTTRRHLTRLEVGKETRHNASCSNHRGTIMANVDIFCVPETLS